MALRTLTGDLRAVEAAGRAVFPGFRLRVVARTPSTQDVVRAAARGGAEAGFCCVAGEQTAGRGRQGRAWGAPAGAALLVSVLLRPSGRVVGGVPLAAGLGVVDALLALGVGDADVGLKWPNDVLVVRDGARGKLAGVLAEVEPRRGGVPAAHLGSAGLDSAGVPAPHLSAGGSAARDVSEARAPHLSAGGAAGRDVSEARAPHLSAGSSPGREASEALALHLSGAGSADTVAVVLGVGLNLTVPSFPPGVAGASLHTRLGRAVGWEEALAALLTALGARLGELERGGVPAIVASWRGRAVGLGERVEAQTPAGVVRGIALDVAEDGALLVDTGSGVVRLLAGDVHLAGSPPAVQGT